MKQETQQHRTVHLVDDNEGIRDLVVRILDTVGLPCVPWSTPEALLDEYGKHSVDALVVDVRLVGMSGLELVRQLRERGVSAPVVFISGVSEIPVAVEAMKLGAHDFLPKPFTAQALIDAVQAALSQHRVRGERDAQATRAQGLVATLSPREREVFLAVVDGKANKVIASDLGLAEKTVEEHRKRVMTKLGASSVADLVKLAVLSGLCDPARTVS
ncbi:MAG: response regulator transcription factor [Candidatus Binatia bacterium]